MFMRSDFPSPPTAQFAALDLNQGPFERAGAESAIAIQGNQAMPIHVVLVTGAVAVAFIAFAVVLAWGERRTRQR
jgi:hypothetical protein